MGLFDFIFKRAPKPRGKYTGVFRMLNGYEPHFSSFGGEIYEAELVRAAIEAISVHCGKLEVTIHGAAKPRLKTKLQHGPNQWQTWSQFLRRLATILYVHNSAIIVPVYDEFGEPSGIFSVIPSRCEIVEYGQKQYMRYTFNNGQVAAVELENCGILTRMQYKDDFFGESNRALLPTMDLINIQNQGIKEGVKSAASYRFWAQLSNFASPEDLAEERKRFNENNFSQEAEGGGTLLFPNTYKEIHQVNAQPWVVSPEEMKIIKDGVFEYFGVNEAVLTNAAYGDAWSAFYEGCIEPFAIQFSEVLTKMLYTFREQTQGSFIMATSSRIQYMSNADKLAVTIGFADRGMATIDELREIWHLPPLPDGLGQKIPIRGEYYDLKDGGVLDEQDSGTEAE